MRFWQWTARWGACAAILASVAGCPSSDDIEDIIDELDDIEIEIEQNVNEIQTIIPADDDFPDVLIQDVGPDVIIIEDNATIITDVQETIIIEELPDITIVGFENVTFFDAYYEYFVNGVYQAIFVFSGETLLIEYPCLDDIEIVSEQYFDIDTGLLVDSFELDGAVFFNPEDFGCGDAFIVSFSEEDIVVDTVAIDLLD